MLEVKILFNIGNINVKYELSKILMSFTLELKVQGNFIAEYSYLEYRPMHQVCI